MINKKSNLVLFPFLFLSTAYGYAGTEGQNRHPLYAGYIAGYGSTTWQGLVASKENQSIALNMAAPLKVEEGGATWGFLAGYEFTPYFALEANYMRYPESKVYFDEWSIFSALHDNALKLTTKTDSISLMGKVMLTIPNSKVRVFSSVGAARLSRKDIIIDDWRLTPTFGGGINYNMSEHIMGEIAGNYTAGFGQSQLSPVDSYYPFLYSVTARLAYRF